MSQWHYGPFTSWKLFSNCQCFILEMDNKDEVLHIICPGQALTAKVGSSKHLSFISALPVRLKIHATSVGSTWGKSRLCFTLFLLYWLCNANRNKMQGKVCLWREEIGFLSIFREQMWWAGMVICELSPSMNRCQEPVLPAEVCTFR